MPGCQPHLAPRHNLDAIVVVRWRLHSWHWFAWGSRSLMLLQTQGSLPWALVWGSARHHQCRTQFIFKNIPNVIRFDALRLHVFRIVRFLSRDRHKRFHVAATHQVAHRNNLFSYRRILGNLHCWMWENRPYHAIYIFANQNIWRCWEPEVSQFFWNQGQALNRSPRSTGKLRHCHGKHISQQGSQHPEMGQRSFQKS